MCKRDRLVSFLGSPLNRIWCLPAWSIMVLPRVLLRISFKLDVYSQHKSLLCCSVFFYSLTLSVNLYGTFGHLFFTLFFKMCLAVSGLIAAHGLQVRPQQWQPVDSVALWHVLSSLTKDQTHVPCIGRQILTQCTSREVPFLF